MKNQEYEASDHQTSRTTGKLPIKHQAYDHSRQAIDHAPSERSYTSAYEARPIKHHAYEHTRRQHQLFHLDAFDKTGQSRGTFFVVRRRATKASPKEYCEYSIAYCANGRAYCTNRRSCCATTAKSTYNSSASDDNRVYSPITTAKST